MGAIAANERILAGEQLAAKGFDIDDKDKEFLTNMSQMKGGEMQITIPQSLMDTFGKEFNNKKSLNFLGNRSDSIIDISVTKGLSNSHFILVQENDLYNDKSNLAYYEIMLPIKKDGGDDFMQNFRFPMYLILFY